MGSWSSSCDEVFAEFLSLVLSRFILEDSAFEGFLLLLICLIPSLFPWGFLQPKEGTALVDPFKIIPGKLSAEWSKVFLPQFSGEVKIF